MDAGEIEKGVEKGVEQNSAATTEWSVKEIGEADEASELKHSGMDTTTETFEPGGGVVDVTPSLGSEAQDELLLLAKPPPETLCNRGAPDHNSASHARRGGEREQQD